MSVRNLNAELKLVYDGFSETFLRSLLQFQRDSHPRHKKFDLTRALHALTMNEVERLAPYEHECSERIAEKV